MTTSTAELAQHRELELKQLGDEIAELAAQLTAATARLLELIRDFDARGGWGTVFARAPNGSHGASVLRLTRLGSMSE